MKDNTLQAVINSIQTLSNKSVENCDADISVTDGVGAWLLELAITRQFSKGSDGMNASHYVDQLIRSLTGIISTWNSKPIINYSGLLGPVSLLAALAVSLSYFPELEEEPETIQLRSALLKRSHKIIQLCSDEFPITFMRSRDYDLMFGTAGLILSTLIYRTVAGVTAFLPYCVQAADIICSYPVTALFSAKDINERAVLQRYSDAVGGHFAGTGMAHGILGLANSLLLLSTELEDQNKVKLKIRLWCKEAWKLCQKSIVHTNGKLDFFPLANVTQDNSFHDGSQRNTSWCYGLGGYIVFLHNLWKECPDDTDVVNEWERICGEVKMLISRSSFDELCNENLSICHGIFGFAYITWALGICNLFRQFELRKFILLPAFDKYPISFLTGKIGITSVLAAFENDSAIPGAVFLGIW
ncbi:lanthionine synthetase LanC family protein [Schleiferilactobacillus harbinensis]|uniref:Lanthionine synthetase C-like protein n=1 Tax=Schleiferilactobacillus harbinensis TaxID=304207 RepID=A0ABU7T3S7_9LACO